MLCPNLGGPTFYFWALHFDSTATLATYQVVMVTLARTAPIEGLAVSASQRVELSRVSQGTELVINRG